MGRPGRYTLSVMVWVASFAMWSGVVGLVVAAVSGDTLDAGDSVSVGVSALFYVALSAVPTVCALVFNDWARDGFPTRNERVSRAARPRVAGAVAAPRVIDAATDLPAAAPATEPRRGAAPEADTGRVETPAPQTSAPPRRRPGPMMPAPLGVPAPAVTPPPPVDGFPVAPLLRDVSDR